MKKKLAVCVTAYEPGGQSVVIEEITKRFAKFYDIDIYCVYSKKTKPEWIRNILYVKPWLNKYMPIINNEFIEQIKKENYDIIHCHDSLPFMNAFYRNNINYFVTCHGNAYWWIRDRLLHKIDGILSLIFYRDAYIKARYVFAISEYIRDWLKTTYNVEPCVIYNGISNDKFYVTKKDDNDKGPILVYFGEISGRKGILDLLFAIKNLTSKYPDILLNIGGFGEKYFIDRVKNYMQKNRLDNNVKILGYISIKEQNKYYNNCDVVITASYWEGFGLNIIEAYQCNKPIFVRNCTSMKEFVRDERFRFNSTKEMISKVDYYFSNKSEFNIDYTKILDSNIFNWDHCAENYLRIFDKY